jgi:hypothetical protein
VLFVNFSDFEHQVAILRQDVHSFRTGMFPDRTITKISCSTWGGKWERALGLEGPHGALCAAEGFTGAAAWERSLVCGLWEEL